MLPVPLLVYPPKPGGGLCTLQLNVVVPVTLVVQLTTVVLAPLHKLCVNVFVIVGNGFTVIAYGACGPGQPLIVEVTVILTVCGEALELVSDGQLCIVEVVPVNGAVTPPTEPGTTVHA
jgi:hypothetical protein